MTLAAPPRTCYTGALSKRESNRLLRRLYDRVMGLADHRHAFWALGAVSFIESSVFPIPPDVMLVPMILAKRDKAWRYAGLCTVLSVLGGIAGYAIGYFLFESTGQPLLEFYGYAAKFTDFQSRYNEWGAWIVFIAGVTPFPYKVITIASGVTALDPVTFLAASIFARGIRFYLVAALLWWLGPPVRDFIERRLGLVTIVFCVLLIGGFVLARHLA